MHTHNRGTRGYSAHFKLQAKKDRLEYVLKKLNPVQNVFNLLSFLPPFIESEKCLLHNNN